MWITFRPMEERDLYWVFEMRNHPEVRKTARLTKKISLAEHRYWFNHSDQIKLICLINGEIGGVVNLATQPGNAVEWSFYLNPFKQFQPGTGTLMLKRIIESLSSSFPLVSKIIARVKKGNLRSVRVHEKLGFIKQGRYWVRKLA